jgi:iron-sulfur cluster repair protein YtfE (RIC family)
MYIKHYRTGVLYRKIASVHGDRHPELHEVDELFGQVNAELLQHLKK